uniref:Uncharacterized protein n=1 Tax=Ananas comosus var. bracteatus TaxID=296719 RepID=A0A6V7QHT5_ANACO|nr:unnamed protein product [Ananas comosus var. bracteatus]
MRKILTETLSTPTIKRSSTINRDVDGMLESKPTFYTTTKTVKKKVLDLPPPSLRPLPPLPPLPLLRPIPPPLRLGHRAQLLTRALSRPGTSGSISGTCTDPPYTCKAHLATALDARDARGDALFKCARIQLALNHHRCLDAALADLLDTARLSPDNAKAFALLGECYEHKGSVGAARSTFDPAIWINACLELAQQDLQRLSRSRGRDTSS